jgi:hypothetical protein
MDAEVRSLLKRLSQVKFYAEEVIWIVIRILRDWYGTSNKPANDAMELSP